MVLSRRHFALAVLSGIWGASIARATRGASVRPALSDITLRDARGREVRLVELLGHRPFTVVVFYSQTCPCFAAHVERLRAIAAELGPRGVSFVLVDSERHGSGEPPRPPNLGAALPILSDPAARLARRLDARFATESIVFDAAGEVRSRGGIDDERKALTSGARPYLREALVSLLDGQRPPVSAAKILGCALRLL